MTYYLRVRAARLVVVGILATVAGVAIPVGLMPITAGPMGATVALALVLALIVPVTAGWACSRGSADLEQVAVRNVPRIDLALVLGVIAGTAAATAAIDAAGASETGLVVSRAVLTFGGLLLAAWWRGGWDTAALLPVLYFLAVAVAGRGEDIEHPAPWAWIATNGADIPAWIAGSLVLAAGLALALHRIRASR